MELCNLENVIYLSYRELKYPNPNPNTNCLARNNSRQFEFENYRNPLHFHYLVKYLVGENNKTAKRFWTQYANQS